MTNFKLYTNENAPDGAKNFLQGAKSKFGFIPNMLAGMAESPAALNGYITLSQIFDETSLNPTEKQIILMTTSALNGCEYCVSAHTVISGMQKIPTDVINAIRDNTVITDNKLQALRELTKSIVESRGFPSPQSLQNFFAAGYSEQQLLEVVLGVSLKTLSNYANHLINTPLDEAFQSAEWHKKTECCVS